MGIWSGPFAFCLIIVTVRGFLLPIEHRAKTPKVSEPSSEPSRLYELV